MIEPIDHPKLPDYEFDRVLGRGGMGTVYLYRHAITGRPEVVKLLSPEVLERPINRGRFEREIRAAFKLNHPNIVAAYSTHRVGDALAFCMEYVVGDDLMRVVQQEGSLSPGVAVAYAVQALYGLQHAHENGMVHRDIKPGNLMRTIASGRTVIKVVDFGLAKLGNDPAATSDTHLTQYGQVLGTPDFIAPEQIRDTSKADIRSDIYSLGCTLYYLMMGRPPFKGDSLYDLFEMHIHSEAPPLHLLRQDVSTELSAVVSRLMAKDPAERPQTPQDAADLLTPFAQAGTHSSPALLLPVDTSPSMATLSTTNTPVQSNHADQSIASNQYQSLSPNTFTAPASTRYRQVKPTVAPERGLPGWVAPVVVGCFLLAGIGAVVAVTQGGPDETVLQTPTTTGSPPTTSSNTPTTTTAPTAVTSTVSSTPTAATVTPNTARTPDTSKSAARPPIKTTPTPTVIKPTIPVWYTTVFGSSASPQQTVWPKGDGWRLRDGALIAPTATDERMALLKLPTTDDFDLTAELQVSGGTGLIIRGDRRAVDEQPTGYLIGLGQSSGDTTAFDCGAVHRWGIKNGRIKHLADGVPSWQKPGVPLKLMVTARGDRLNVRIDDRPMITVRDVDGYGGGQFGFVTQAGGQLSVTALSLTSAESSPVAAAATEPGFSSMLVPNRLTGWELEGDDRCWEAAGPVLFGRQNKDSFNSKGHLLTTAEYSNFVLRFQFLLKPGSTALVNLRAVKGELADVTLNGMKTPVPTHPWLRLVSGTDDSRPRPASLERWFAGRANMAPARGQPIVSELTTDTWHDAEIKVEGHAITVILNNKLVEYPKFKADPRFDDPKFPAGHNRPSGRLGFSPMAGEVLFRNIRVKSL